MTSRASSRVAMVAIISPAKPALGQQWQPPAVIKVGVRQQHKIDAGWIETKVAGIFLCDLATTLIEPAIDQKAPAGAFDEVA